jgi:hypothetical protein
MWPDQDVMPHCTRAALQGCAQRIAAGLFRDEETGAATLRTGALTAIFD